MMIDEVVVVIPVKQSFFTLRRVLGSVGMRMDFSVRKKRRSRRSQERQKGFSAR